MLQLVASMLHCVKPHQLSFENVSSVKATRKALYSPVDVTEDELNCHELALTTKMNEFDNKTAEFRLLKLLSWYDHRLPSAIVRFDDTIVIDELAEYNPDTMRQSSVSHMLPERIVTMALCSFTHELFVDVMFVLTIEKELLLVIDRRPTTRMGIDTAPGPAKKVDR